MLLRCRERSELLGVDNPVITLVLGLVLGGALERLDELARQTPDGFGLPLDAQTPLLRAPFALHRFMVAAGLGRLDEARAWLDRVEALLAEGAALDGDGRWLVARLSTFAGDERCRERLVRLSRG